MAADCLRNMTVVLFGGQKFRGAYEDSVRDYEITRSGLGRVGAAGSCVDRPGASFGRHRATGGEIL